MAKNNALECILETAGDMHRLGIMSDDNYNKITMRHLGKPLASINWPPINATEIRAVREKAHLSQAVFARCLNVTTGYISQLERGIKQASGPVLVLLNVIRREGIEIILH